MLSKRRSGIKHTNLTFSSLELACDRNLSNLASMVVDQVLKGGREGNKRQRDFFLARSKSVMHDCFFHLQQHNLPFHSHMPTEASSPVDQATLDAVAALQQLSQDPSPSNKNDSETKLVCKWEDCGRVFPDHTSFKTHLSEGISSTDNIYVNRD